MEKNLIIKEWCKTKDIIAKSYRTKKYYNSILKVKFIDFKCYMCKKDVTMSKKVFDINKPCTNCRKKLRGSISFMKRAKAKFGDKFDLSQTNYIDSSTKVSVRCIKHNNTYDINPMEFAGKRSKGGCKYCAVEAQVKAIKKPIDYYLQVLNERFPQFSVVAHGVAKNNQERIHLMCEHHGEFSKTLHSIVSKESVYLCPGCNNDLNAWKMRTLREDVKGKVYFIHFTEINLFKCGVTYRDISKRLKEFKQATDLIWYIEFNTLSDAYFFEHQFFRYYSELRYRGDRAINSGGYTELFTKIINKPTERFIEEILCLKESNSGELPPT